MHEHLSEHEFENDFQPVPFLPTNLCLKKKKQIKKKIFLMFIYFERERQSVSRGGAESERDTESKAGSRLQTVSIEPHTGLKPTNREIMT